METMVMVLMWFIVSDFWLEITIQKLKNLFPLKKSKKSNFFWKLMKN